MQDSGRLRIWIKSSFAIARCVGLSLSFFFFPSDVKRGFSGPPGDRRGCNQVYHLPFRCEQALRCSFGNVQFPASPHDRSIFSKGKFSLNGGFCKKKKKKTILITLRRIRKSTFPFCENSELLINGISDSRLTIISKDEKVRWPT